VSLSNRHPWLYAARVAELRLARDLSDGVRHVPFASSANARTLPVRVVQHGSLLRRRLGSTDPCLQETKIVNLALAAHSVDGVTVDPGEIFSFWRCVGPPSAERGFVDGLLLAGGEVRVGTGGGLCQLSNLLYWMALHTPLKVIERHRHGFDPFPDDRRVLPFGSGATVFFNYVDLRLRNTTDQPFQFRVWLTATHLRGSVLTDRPWPLAYHVEERGHRFVRSADGRTYRDNELWRRTVDRRTGDLLAEALVCRNHCEVKYATVPLERVGAAAGDGLA
jgi:vancomycin resistance protein VanW